MRSNQTSLTARAARAFALFAFFAVNHPNLLSAGEANLATVRYAVTGRTSTDWPWFIAKEKRLYQKHGIFLEDIIIQGAANTTRAVISNTLPVGRIAPDFVMEAVDRGAKTKIIAGDMNKIPYDLYARADIKTGQELRGKTLGVSALSGGTTAMLEEVLEKAFGLTRKDYQVLVVGTSPDRYAALKGGSVAATIMAPPFTFRSQKDGFRRLVQFHDVLGPIDFVVSFAHDDYVKNNRAELVKFTKAMIEAARWLYDPKNREEALAIHIKYLKGNREGAENDYKYLVEEFKPWPLDGTTSKQGMDKTMELRVKGGKYEGKKVPPLGHYIDYTIAEDAKKELGIK
ncbi:MAG: ABC transporter substrate-binding protein [Deltaproteobacteria bacterium]|nr:ABC transporter substrate-binding protein [Deltaproteobacteria bacterium]